MYKDDAMKCAIEVAKEAARGGHGDPAYILETTYKKILELHPPLD